MPDLPVLSFVVSCEPVAMPRLVQQYHHTGNSKAYVRKLKDGSAHPVIAYKQLVAIQAKMAVAALGDSWRQVQAQPMACTLVFVFERPGRLKWTKKPMPRCWHAIKPDTDNLLKAFFDGATGIIYNDDIQIVVAHGYKCFASGHESACVEATFSPLLEEVVTPACLAVVKDDAPTRLGRILRG